MRLAIALCMFALAALIKARPADNKYTDRYDNINLDEVLNNKRLLEPYVKCILDQGKCAPDAKELKEHIKEALENDCGKCTEAQKKGTVKVITYLINHEEMYWNELTAKYDKEKKYTPKLEKKLRQIKA